MRYRHWPQRAGNEQQSMDSGLPHGVPLTSFNNSSWTLAAPFLLSEGLARRTCVPAKQWDIQLRSSNDEIPERLKTAGGRCFIMGLCRRPLVAREWLFKYALKNL